MEGVNLSMSLLAMSMVVGVGAVAAWLGHRRTKLSPLNWHLAGGVVLTLLAADIGVGASALAPEMAVGLAGIGSGALVAARLSRSARGGGGEALEHELSRVMAWTAWAERGTRRSARIGSQGEVVTERRWPEGVEYVPLSSQEDHGRVPRGEGRHILVVGGTGSGKTVSADRIALGRVLTDRVPALVLDPKGDGRLARDLSSLANYLGRPFIVFDPMAEDSDRWDPLWSLEPGRTVARIVSPLQSSEPYYADTLRIHLGVVAEALQLLGLWPVSMPLLLDAAQADSFDLITRHVRRSGGPPELTRRVEEQALFLSSPSGRRDIASGAARLRVVVGTSWRGVLSPRPDGRAVQLPAALRAGAIVLWRTWVEDLPDEAEAITTLALADIIAAAAGLNGETEWVVLLDEFGSVMEGNASRRALGVLGRARSAGGQAIVVTQSAADVPTATGSDSLLESLADNFSAFVVHRQTSAASREWVAKLLGTRELWQSTDRTGGAGRFTDGTGSRRRVREFLVRPDQLKDLGVGEAYVWTAAGPPPELVDVAIAPSLAQRPPGSKEGVYLEAGARELPPYESHEVADGDDAQAAVGVVRDEPALSGRHGVGTNGDGGRHP
jgi:hypothetical protein